MTDVTLPPFPVDDQTLDLLWTAIRPGPEAERSSLGEVLDLYSRMGGSDPDAIEEVMYLGAAGGDVPVYRDPLYAPSDVIGSLIVEVRRLRKEITDG